MYLGKVVEEGPTRPVFRAPRHPYTHALLSANPVIDPERRRTKMVLAGRDPEPVKPAAGLPLPHALPARAGALPGRGAAADAGLLTAAATPATFRWTARHRGFGVAAERPVLVERRDDRPDGVMYLRGSCRKRRSLSAGRPPAQPPSARRRSAAARARSSRAHLATASGVCVA